MSPDEYNERIELLVNDENRIVTYKVLSQELKIHVNKAKCYMMEYFNDQKVKGINLEVNYFLAGFSEMNGLRTVKVLVVSDDHLEKAKESFTELTSCHIYSIYKGVSKDDCALYSADFTYTKDKDHNKYSAIIHPNIEIQPPVLNKMAPSKDVKMNFSKKESHSSANGNVASVASKKGKEASPAAKTSPDKSDTPKDNQEKESKGNKISPDASKQKSGTLMSMWQKKEQSNGVKKESSKAENKGKQVAKNAPKNNIMSMFSKQAVKNSEKPPISKPVIKEKSPQKNVPEVAKKESSPKKAQTNNSKKTSQKRKVTNKHLKSSKSKHDSDSEGEFQKSKAKKHRRICTFDDSSESEPEEEKEKAQRSFFLPEEPMDTVEATPVSDDSEEPIPPTPPIVHVKGKAKVWKTVQKTFEDEDGFFVTKSLKELVSASEGEEDPLKDSTVKKTEVVEKKNLLTNKKQASLMSFFKQK